jgi:tetratricopeptide (TPR) repeat protein
MLNKIFIPCLLFISSWATAQKADSFFNESMDSGYHYLFKFMARESMQNFGNAIREARRLNNNHHYADALFGAGQATWYAGNFKNAADTIELALKFWPADDKKHFIGAYRILSNVYDDLGEYEKAFKAVQLALIKNEGSRDEENQVLLLVQLGKLYQNIGDLESASHYYQMALDEKPVKGEYPFRELHHCMGELYAARKQFDSAAWSYRQSFIGNPLSRVIRIRLGELHLMQQHYDSAYYFLHPVYEEVLPVNDINMIAATAIGLGKIAYEQGDLRNAVKLATDAYSIASQKGVFRFYESASELLASIYEKLGDAGSALHYRKLYDSLKETASTDVFKGQLFAFRQRSEAASHEADMQSLRASKKIADRTIIIVCLAAVLAIAFIVFRYQNIRLRLKQRASELEMQALRAQMNPHFIFNCLSAINHFILDNQNDKASDYLTRFSRLVRMVLVNAGKDAISLEEELDMLRLYLDMEQLRFKQAFTYTIDIPNGLPASQLQVPCFILQPFCENAIWHGLLHKEGEGKLAISFKYFEGILLVTIRDNGIGRQKAAALGTKQHSSMGQQLTASRLALFNKNRDERSSMEIHDLKDANEEVTGTEIILYIQTPL